MKEALRKMESAEPVGVGGHDIEVFDRGPRPRLLVWRVS